MNLFAFILLFHRYLMVDPSKWKKCNDSGFCVRQQAFADLIDTIQDDGELKNDLGWEASDFKFGGQTLPVVISASVKMKSEPALFNIEFLFSNDYIRFKMVPKEGKRYETGFSIEKEEYLNVVAKDKGKMVVAEHNGKRLEVDKSPFNFRVYQAGELIMSFNRRGYLYYESVKKGDRGPKFAQALLTVDAVSEDSKAAVNQTGSSIAELKQKISSKLGEESFGGNTDSKPNGATSLGFDLLFENTQHVFGIPEHSTAFNLKSTRGPEKQYDEPFRLYNVDIFEHLNDSPMAMYGSVPLMMGHKKGHTSAVLLLNSAEMWVDIERIKHADEKLKSTSSHWMVESGIVDLFLFVGPTQTNIFNAYTKLTGRPQLPQEFAIGHHSCRWNYNNEKDALQVDAGFDKHEIPYDVLWLDIEHTDGKRYFTFDNIKFPDPVGLQTKLANKGRKMVTIIDPHIKKDDNYYVSKKAAELDIFVKTKDATVLDGECWPGQSNWIDYTSSKARDFWAEQFDYKNYKGSTPSLYTWNDMNEPSVFSGPEVTMPKDSLHFNNVEHRDVHNVYGMLLHRSTFEGQLKRSKNTDRPFVLSRAFFVGTQRYGAIWTGDNTASWEYLKTSIPMTLSISIAGITFCGADVGGFFGNPDPELLVRWYQMGAFQPFFRAHAELTTKRREPWLFGEPHTSLIKAAIEKRYKLLPYIYTLFQESHSNGNPIVRSMMQEYPENEATFGMDNQFMLGPCLVVKPVDGAGIEEVKTYLPNETKSWYDYDTFAVVSVDPKTCFAMKKTPMDVIPVYIRGGSIFARKDRLHRSSLAMKSDPFTLIVALENGLAKGSLYVDDGHSFEYQQGNYLYVVYEFSNNALKSKRLHAQNNPMKPDDSYNTRIERIVILGLENLGKIASIKGSGSVEIQHFSSAGILTLKNPNFRVGEDWEISINTQ